MSTLVKVQNELHDHGARKGHWSVYVGSKQVSRHRKKSRALKKARQKARANAPAVLKVQNTSGHWKTEASY